MNLRGQILLGSVMLAVVPLVLVILSLRSAVQSRFTALDTARVDNQMLIVQDDLERQNREMAILLDKLAETITADNNFRLAAVAGREDLRGYLLDFAPRQMALMDLDMLLIQDPQGRALSSGHFRSAYGVLDPRLADQIGRTPRGQALVSVRVPEGSFLALARTRTVSLGGQDFHLTGGTRLDQERLASLNREGDLALALVWPGGHFATGDHWGEALGDERNILDVEYRLRRRGIIVRTEHLPLIDGGMPGDAWLLVTHDRASLRVLLADINLRMGAVLLLAIVGSIILAVLLAGRISKPLRELATTTQELDLDRLDATFTSNRRDEVGDLTRLLGEMTARLRDGVKRLRQAEHRATTGEMARQVNHDIRNGLTPLRNVMRHLAEVARDEPRQLATVFQERQETLEGGLAYLEELATRYARLSPGRHPEPCRLADITALVLADPGAAPDATLINAVPAGLPPIMADPVSLRRIMENLVRNSLEALPDGQGTVTVDATLDEDPRLEEMRILVSVSDTGRGIPAADIENIFNDFFTTKDGGTGLGLSNVRRLAADCGANIRVTSEPDRGTTFHLSFPVPHARDNAN